MTNLVDTVQKQEIVDGDGNLDSLVELFDITLPGYDAADSAGTFYLFNGTDLEQAGNKIEFAQNDYEAIPIQITGIEIASSGAIARPTLTVANIPVLTKTRDSSETVLQNIRNDSNLNLPFERNDDLIGTRVVYRQAFLSDCNTDAATPDELPPQTYYIDRIASENNLFVVFELASPMDLERVRIPAREVIGQYCPWQYQGRDLGFGGGCTWRYKESEQHSFFRKDDSEITGTINAWSATYNNPNGYSAGDIVKTTNAITSRVQIWEALFDNYGKNPETNRQYWKRIDLCGKTMNSCKIRFQGNASDTTLNTEVPLPFGGFPGAKKFK